MFQVSHFLQVWLKAGHSALSCLLPSLLYGFQWNLPVSGLHEQPTVASCKMRHYMPHRIVNWAGFFHVLFKCFPYQVTFLYLLYLILQCSQPSSSATTMISAYCLSFSTSWAMKIISILCLNSFKASTLLGICQFISNHFPHDTMVDILRDGHISRTKKTGKQMVFPQYSIQAWPLVHIILTLLPLTLKGPRRWDLLNYQSKTRCGL